jgi:hypothetical protein
MNNTKKILFSCGVLLTIFLTTLTINKLPDRYTTDIFDWTQNKTHPTYTIYFQGILGSQAVGARYTGKRGFISTTGEWLSSPQKGVNIVYNLFPATIISEVQPFSHYKLDKNLFTRTSRKAVDAIYNQLFGIVASREIPEHFADQPYYINEKDRGKSSLFYTIELSKISGAQEKDIRRHKEKMMVFDEFCSTHKIKDPQVVLFGDSRGAAATFVSFATNYNDPLYKNIKLVVLEGCYDDVEHVIEDFPLFSWMPKKIQQAIHKGGSNITDHTVEGISPIKLANKFTHHVPVVFVTSKKDKIVSNACTKNIARAVAKAGHPHVYLIELERAGHRNYPFHNKQDTTTYLNTIHSLYKKLGLAYIEQHAQLSEQELEQYRLS